MREEVILVDENDHEIGVMEKMEAHRKGTLHRAFSVFLFNGKNEYLLHQRTHDKYHSAGLWTNTCCSHPRPNEQLLDGAHRRLREEMGIECELKKMFQFTYHADVGNGLAEHEVDHVFYGFYDAVPRPNAEEVQDWKWMNEEELKAQLSHHPENFTTWFRIAAPMVIDFMKHNIVSHK